MQSERGRVPRALLIPALLLAALAFVYLATRPLGGGPQPSFFVIGSAGPGLQIGQIAPGTARAGGLRLPLIDLDGAPVELGAFNGRPLWLIFWKTACEPCEAEAPDVAAAYAANRASGLALLGVDVWDSTTVVSDYSRDHALAYPIAVDPSAAFMSAYGVWGAPTHYFIDADGIIRDRYFGPMTPDLIADALRTIIPADAP